jgi:hypothetical protein
MKVSRLFQMTLERERENENENENVGVGVSLASSKGTAVMPTPGATTNNKPGVVQQLLRVMDGRRGDMPVMGMHETAALTGSGSGRGNDG